MSQSPKQHAIFLAFDQGYASHARACLNSLRCNYPNYPPLLVYYEGNDPDTLAFLQSFERLRLLASIEIMRQVSQFHLGVVNHPGVYYKYHAWSPELDEFENVLYLDVDTMVLKPLDSLLDTRDFFAVSNHGVHPKCRPFYPQELTSVKLLDLLDRDGLTTLTGIDDMCNAGVLLVPRKCRNQKNLDQLCQITVDYDAVLQFADQSVISIWCRLHGIVFNKQFKYNYQTIMFQDPETRISIGDIAIMHFSNFKPDTVEFMVHNVIDSSTRKQLAKMYQGYAHGVC